jgi:hypothetical protein
MNNKSNNGNFKNSFENIESELKLEEYKRFEVLLFCNNLIESVKQSVTMILNNEQPINNQYELLQEATEIKKNINEYSIALPNKVEKEVIEINKDLSFLIDELEKLYRKVQVINSKILLID